MNRNETVIYSYIQSVAKYNKCSSNLEHLYDECIEDSFPSVMIIFGTATDENYKRCIFPVLPVNVPLS